MSPSHRRALRATARVVALAALTGCGEKKPPTQVTESPDTEPRSRDSLVPEVPEGLTADTCDTMLDEVQAEELERAGDAPPQWRLTLEQKQCCALELDANTKDWGAQWEHRTMCCTTFEWQAGGACTPWGPPTPPGASATDDDDVRSLDLRRAARSLAPSLPDAGPLAEAAIATWLGRMVNEYGSHRVFAALADQLESAGVERSTVASFRDFVGEEQRHGVLCGAVVEALGGQALAELPAAEPWPAHAEVEPLEAALRNVLSVCCLSETVAVALIAAEREEMPESELRELLTSIWADEVGHASTGWRLLRDLLPDDPAMKARLGDWLRVAFHHLEAHELAHLPERTWPEGAERYGLCDGHAARELFFAAVTEVIVPALEAEGLPASRAWRQRAAA